MDDNFVPCWNGERVAHHLVIRRYELRHHGRSIEGILMRECKNCDYRSADTFQVGIDEWEERYGEDFDEAEMKWGSEIERGQDYEPLPFDDDQ